MQMTEVPTTWELAAEEFARRSQAIAAETGEKHDPRHSMRVAVLSSALPTPGGEHSTNPYDNCHSQHAISGPHSNRNSLVLPHNPRNTFQRQRSMALPVHHRELVTSNTPKKTTMHFIVSKHSGFTKSLYNAAEKAKNNGDEKGARAPLQVMGMFEGPYGGHQSYDSYGTAVFVAGGVGITHCIGYVKHLLHGFNEGTAATQKIKLVWVIRKVENIEWAADWLEEILRMPHVRQVVEVDIYITRPSEAATSSGWSGRGGMVNLYAGRPDFEVIVEKVVKKRIGAMAVNVCGGGGVSDSVRAAARKFVDVAAIDFSEESFSW